MQKQFRITVLSVLIGSLVLLPCASQGSSDGSSPGRPSGNQQGPSRPERPQPTESELTVLRLMVLADTSQAKPKLAVTAVQAKALLPILEAWEAALSSNPKASPDEYVQSIASVLTAAQNAFIPEPPEPKDRGTGPSGTTNGKGQQPPAGGPEKVSITELLSELIKTLSV